MEPTQRVTEEQEKVVKRVVDHWLTLTRPLTLYVAGCFVVVILYVLGLYMSPIPHAILLCFDLMVVWIIHHWMFIYLFHRELSPLILTNRRLLDFRFLPFVMRDIVFIDVKEIREIGNNQHGLIKNIFNYGSVSILLEGNEEVHFHNIPHPEQVLDIIQEVVQNGPGANHPHPTT